MDVCTKFASHICLLCKRPQRCVKQTTDKLSWKYFVSRYVVLIFQVQFKDFVNNYSLRFLKCFRIREPPIWGISKKSESKNGWVSWKNQQRTSGILGDYLTFSKKLRNIATTTKGMWSRWHVSLFDVKLSFQCNICHNNHHIIIYCNGQNHKVCFTRMSCAAACVRKITFSYNVYHTYDWCWTLFC